MDAGLVAIGRRAGTTNALSISSNLRATLQLIVHRSSEAEGDQTERVISERVPASEGGRTSDGHE